MTQTTPSELDMLPALRGLPNIDLNRHVMLALRAGRSASAILLEAARLMRGPGKLSGSEYFYYRLWNEDIGPEQKREFVGRKAQNLMHVACNDRHWYQTAADKILFQTIMTGAGLPVPETLAVTQPLRWLPQAEALRSLDLFGREVIGRLGRSPNATDSRNANPSGGAFAGTPTS